jgi:hypothetical protein
VNSEIALRRLHSARLHGGPFDGAAEVVRWFGAVQSQDYGPAKWSLGQRMVGATDAAIDEAFAAGAILRTHVLRPTWHFVTPADIRWMLELTAPRVHALNAYYYRQLELAEPELTKTTGLLVQSLEGGRQLTRSELRAVFADAGIGTGGFRLGYILMHAELNGVVCSGALRGKQHTYALLDERAPEVPGLQRDEALAELTLRYFTSHGPATVKDFRWWSSLTMADIRTGLDLAGPQLERMTVDGLEFWFAPSEPPAAPPSPTVHLLQAYDEYTVAYADSKATIDLSGAARAQSGDRPNFNNMIVLDGQLAGCWKRAVRKDAVVIETLRYLPFDATRKHALDDAAQRHGRFLGLPAAVL